MGSEGELQENQEVQEIEKIEEDINLGIEDVFRIFQTDETRKAEMSSLIYKNYKDFALGIFWKVYNLYASNNNLEQSDIVNAAMVGMFRAAHKYDSSRGSFLTYSYPFILEESLNEVYGQIYGTKNRSVLTKIRTKIPMPINFSLRIPFEEYERMYKDIEDVRSKFDDQVDSYIDFERWFDRVKEINSGIDWDILISKYAYEYKSMEIAAEKDISTKEVRDIARKSKRLLRKLQPW